MNIIQRIFNKGEKREKNPLNIQFVNSGSDFAITSNYDEALKVNVIHACVSIIAGAISRMPLYLYKRLKDGSREKAFTHRLYDVSLNPNPQMTSCSFFYALLTNLLLYGNAYIQKIKNTNGVKLNLIPSKYVNIHINKAGDIEYQISMLEGGKVVSGNYTDKEILHVVGESLDGIQGISPIEQLKTTVEFSKILELYGKTYFENGAMFTCIIDTHGKSLTEEAAMRLRKNIKDNYTGIKNVGKTMVLEDGYTAQFVSGGNDSSQFLQTKESMIAEVARVYNVPLHLLQETTKSTSWGSGIEQMGIDFVRYTLDVHIKRIEQAFNTLLDLKDRRDFYFEFNKDSLLGGDQEQRYRAYQIGLMCGFISPNEIRQKENMPKIDGGDLYFAQLNTPPYAGADKEKYLKEMTNGDSIQNDQ